MTTPSKLFISAAMALATSSQVALADITIPGNVVIPAGTVLEINDDMRYTGSLTIEEGVTVRINGPYRIFLAREFTTSPATSLRVLGTAESPVIFQPTNGLWGGIISADSTHLQHTHISDTESFFLIASGTDLTIDQCHFFDSSQTLQPLDRRIVSFGSTGTLSNQSATVTDSTFGPFALPTRSNEAFAISATAGSILITDNYITGLQGGTGVQGVTGSTGSQGSKGNNGTFTSPDGKTGGTGSVGGTGRNGLDGAPTTIIRALVGTGPAVIAQNVIDHCRGGTGGKGGTGGRGGKGGTGGDGYSSAVMNGGDGGRGGKGGQGGKGGTGGRSGDFTAFDIETTSATASDPLVVNNTVTNIEGEDGGVGGSGGAGGSGGNGGDAGSAGFPFNSGNDGSTGSRGTNGFTGARGTDAFGIFANSARDDGFTIPRIKNNIATFTGLHGTSYGVRGQSNTNIITDASNNLFYRADIYAEGAAEAPEFTIIDEDPLFTDPAAGDYRPLPGSRAIDSGENPFVPDGLDTDFDGFPRFMDDPAAQDIGVGGGPGGSYIIDMGAFEAFGEFPTCDADLNADGILDNGDIIAFVNLFLAQDLAADTNADGILDNGDIITFVQLFLAGC